MWWRLLLAGVSLLLALAMLALFTGLVSARVEVSPGVPVPNVITFVGMPLGFLLALAVMGAAATPLAIHLLRRRPKD